MCDLWKNTTTETVPPGAIPAQIDFALQNLHLRGARPASVANDDLHKHTNATEAGRAPDKCNWHIKLYNSGSFFDHAAIPPESYSAIIERVSQFGRVIVECHPKLVSDEVLRFRDLLGTRLEIAMGLETANLEVLARLNKGMTLDDFATAAKFLTGNGIAVRAFILLKPPFTTEDEGVSWAKRSIDFAFDCGVTVACVIPTRTGNGALDALEAGEEFSQPHLTSLEEVLDYGISLKRGRVFADLWDLKRFSDCAACFQQRKERLHGINLSQQPRAAVTCPNCER